MRSITREMMVLFTDGDWRISRTGYGDGSGIWHKCEDEFKLTDGEWWHYYRADKCGYCGTAIPAEIRGLYMLHTWDR